MIFLTTLFGPLNFFTYAVSYTGQILYIKLYSHYKYLVLIFICMCLCYNTQLIFILVIAFNIIYTRKIYLST